MSLILRWLAWMDSLHSKLLYWSTAAAYLVDLLNPTLFAGSWWSADTANRGRRRQHWPVLVTWSKPRPPPCQRRLSPMACMVYSWEWLQVRCSTVCTEVKISHTDSFSIYIPTDETYTHFYPTNYQPLKLLLGNPVYLELRLESPESDAVILVNYCLAYPRSATRALVLVYEG